MNVLVAIGGHPFDRGAFDALLASLPNITFEVVKHPEAARRMNASASREFDALLLYDLPGLDFRDANDPPRVVAPTREFMAGFEALLEAGIGIVALHHALAGWPAWPGYADALGGTFLYRPAVVRGCARPDSGYASDTRYTARLLRLDHPVLRGLPVSFELCDELYLGEVFGDDIEPLIEADCSFEPQRFRSAAAAVRGVNVAASAREIAPASRTIAWARRAYSSRIVYLQPGDTAETLRNAHYQHLVANALHWVAA